MTVLWTAHTLFCTMLRRSAHRIKPLLSFYGGPFSYNLWQIRAPRAALIIEVSRLLRRQSAVISSDQSNPLGINAIAFDQAVKLIRTATAVLVALGVKKFELTDRTDHRAVAKE